jgi:tRNA dimethylallyltransferase
MIKNAVLIAGPTASGKSAAALHLARRHGGIIVNADAMQVYDVLRVLTARPDDADLAAVEHRLYGHVPPGEVYSTGSWLRDVGRLIDDGAFENRMVVFCGGTGLYFRGLLGGIADMPDIDAEIRASVRASVAELGAARAHQRLADVDGAAAARIGVNDAQRIARALEVFTQTGKPLTHWQAGTGAALVDPDTARRFVLLPERQWLRERIALRLSQMIGQGAMDEAARIAAMDLGSELPVMKAIGLRPLIRALRGEIGVDQAVELSVHETRQFAKRQRTWFRNQCGPEWTRLKLDSAEGAAGSGFMMENALI